MRSERVIHVITRNVNIELHRDAAVCHTSTETHTKHNRDTTRYRPGRDETNPNNESHLYFLALDLHGFLPEIHADGGFGLTGKGSAGEAEG